MKIKQGVLFVISAPTGGGKTSITTAVCKKLAEKIPITQVITYTTRPPRTNEQHGTDYIFVKEKEFLEKKQENFFLETNFYAGNWYGSPRSIFQDLAHGLSLVLVLDRSGAKIIKKIIPAAVLIWIEPPNVETLTQRLFKRESETSQLLRQRLEVAKQEMAQENQEPFFTYHVMNENINKAVDEVSCIIMKYTMKPQ